MIGGLKAVVRPGLRAIAILALWVVVLSAAPWLADELDRRGLPGAAVALLVVFGLAALSLVMVRRSRPRLRRIRTLSSAARAAGYGWRSRIHVPSSMFRLPSFRGGAMTVQLFNLVVVDREANASLIFDVAELPDPGYGDTSWRTVVAAHVPYELPALVAAPRRVRSVDLPGDLEIAPTDLATVNERWLVRTEDRAFAAAFLDQRMLAWIDTLDGDLCLEAGGPWLLVSAGTMVGPEGWGPLLGALDAYRGRVPRVVTSLYPGTTAASFPS